MERLGAKELWAKHFSGGWLHQLARVAVAKSAFDQQYSARPGTAWPEASVQDAHICARHSVDAQQHYPYCAKRDFPGQHDQFVRKYGAELVRRGVLDGAPTPDVCTENTCKLCLG